MGNLPTGLPLHEAQKSESQERDGRGNAGMPGVDPRKMGRFCQYIETEGSPFAPKIWYNLSVMVEFKKTNYFVGFWFVGGKDQDWFACVYREQGQTNWDLVHRFRYRQQWRWSIVRLKAAGLDLFSLPRYSTEVCMDPVTRNAVALIASIDGKS